MMVSWFGRMGYWELGAKENLAHESMDVYSLCLSFHLDISKRLKRGQREILVNLQMQRIESPIWKSP